MPSLGDIAPPCRGRWSDGKRRDEREDCLLQIDHDGDCRHPAEKPKASEAPKGQSLADAVADPLCAPFGWQTACPDEVFTRGEPVGDSPDLQRILKLKRRAPLDLNSVEAEAMVQLAMERYGKPPNPSCTCKQIDPRRSCITQLLPIQAWALREIDLYQGMLAHISVGAGKTIIGILAALALRDVQKVLILIPASLVGQIQRDYRMLREHFDVPGIVVHSSKTARKKNPPLNQTFPNKPTLHVLPYSRLSGEEQTDWIKNLAPDAIISDEVDSVRNMSSSRAMRVFNYISGKDCTPELFGGDAEAAKQARQKRQRTKFCGWTGSLTDKSIKEMFHLSLLALRNRSPLPLDPRTVEEWSQCLDAVTVPTPPGRLMDFCEDGEDVRRGYQRRLAETPGFIIMAENKVYVRDAETGLDTDREVEVDIRPRDLEIPEIIEEALARVREGQRPDSMAPDGRDGEDSEMEDALEQFQVAQQISCGVLYRHRYPRGEPVWLIDKWKLARKLYNREVRLKAMEGNTFLDSAKLCMDAAKRAWGDEPKVAGRPDWKNPHWPGWRDIMDKVKPQPEAIMLHDFVCEDAAEWAESEPGIVWFRMKALAKRIYQLTGLPVHDGGPGAEDRLVAETGKRSIICSISSNGRGRDGLQHVFSRQSIINFPSGASMVEQIMGRAVRRGQKQDAVTTEVYSHTPELRKAIKQAMRRSKYVRDILRADVMLLKGWKALGYGLEDDEKDLDIDGDDE